MAGSAGGAIAGVPPSVPRAVLRFRGEAPMAGQGSAGNVIAALASFFIPGLGQLLQGRLVMALIQFCLAAALWFILMGWIIHLWSILDAALWKPRAG
jgi:TM2 domain-containing membrane protein YozV